MKRHRAHGTARTARTPRCNRFGPTAAAAIAAIGAALGLGVGAASAQLPRPSVAAQWQPAPIEVLDLATASSALVLKRGHMEVEIDGDQADLRTTLIYRNDGSAPVLARFALPWPDVATVTALNAPVRAGSIDSFARGGAVAQARAGGMLDGRTDDCSGEQELAEVGEPLPSVHEQSLTRVAPGASVVVSWRRRVALIERAGHYRLVLPLAGERGGAFRPSFSASVRIASEQRVVELSSGSHRARVAGIGTQHARLTVAPVRAREGQFFALDFRLQPVNAQEKIRKVAFDESAKDAAAIARADRSGS